MDRARPRARAAGRRRRRDLAAALPLGPRDRDEARPHARDRGRSRGRGRAAPDPRGRAARRRDPRRGAGRRRLRLAPLDPRPDRRDAELRARDPGLGDAHRARGGRRRPARAWCRRPRSGGAGGPSADQARSRTETRSTSPRSRRIEDAVLSFAIENDVPDVARRAWHARGFGDFWPYMLVAEGAVDGAIDGPGVKEWDLAAMQVIVEEAGGRFSDHARRTRGSTAGARSRRTASSTTSCSPLSSAAS